MIFLDTSFWYAFQVPSDVNHAAAAALLRSRRRPLLTSDRVCEETWTLLRRRRGHRAAVRFADYTQADGSALAIRPVDAATAAQAWAWLRARPDREFSFVDASSFALMRALAVTEAFAFDGDFAAAGFVELRP